MRTLGALEARFADDHVPLALVLGAIGPLSAIRKLLPGEPVGSTGDHADPPPEPGAFVALLLGVIVTHDRLLGLFGEALAEHGDGDDGVAVRGDDPLRLKGLLR